ncbi:MAG: hypothetical protein AB7S44_01490 [Spirochaetales bacterium]
MTELKLKKLVNAIAYFSIIFLAVALIFSQIAQNNTGLFASISNIFTVIANSLAYIIVGFGAFFYVKTKRNILYMISYIVAVILVIIFVIIPLF